MSIQTGKPLLRPLALAFVILTVAQQAADASNWTATGSMQAARAYHTASLLLDGQVLVAGGTGISNLFFTYVLSSAELYDPTSGTWSSAGAMTSVRSGHTATLLTNGTVLVTGGSTGSGTNVLSSAELFDPDTKEWTATGSMITGRYGHTATLLTDGRVLVVGGNSGSGVVSSAELYDPLAGTWTAASSLATARSSHTATLLTDGTVLVAGGGNGSAALSSAERYFPHLNIWVSAGSMANTRQQHSATLLPNGMALVAGGYNNIALTSAELYDPIAGTWTPTGSMANARAAHAATPWPGGKVLVTGGFQLSGIDYLPLASVEFYDSSAGAWTTVDSLETNLYYHTATLLTNNDVLVAGGTSGGFSYQAGAELLPPPVFSQIDGGLPGAYQFGGNLYPSSVAWGDFDNDGQLDFILTGFNERYPTWHNNGDGFTNVISYTSIDIETAIAVGDFNNDGFLDIVDDSSGIWSNTGSDFTNLHIYLPFSPGVDSAFGSVAWGDYDNDGRPDLLVSGYTIDAYGGWTTNAGVLWHNSASDGFIPSQFGPPGVYYGTVAWGDYDGDGLLDILLTGIGPSGNPITQVWRNTGHGFTNINAGLPGVAYGSAAWGDFDNDGRLDILLTGATNLIRPTNFAQFTINLGPFETSDGSSTGGVTPSSGNPTGFITQIWRNTGGGFTNINAGLPGVWAGSAAWGDYDNDGRLDILLTGATSSFIFTNPSDAYFPNYTDYVSVASGFISQVWRNTGNGFSNIDAGLPGVAYSSGAWGDYDNDGRLDVLLAGATAVDGSGNVTAALAQIWKNYSPVVNTPPAAPTGLTATLQGNLLVFSWNAASDSQTPAQGLTYNLRVGTTPGGGDLVAPMSANSGFHRLAQMGNVQEHLSWTVANLPFGRPIYWSVQAIDTAFAGSPFAPEQTLTFNTVPTPPNGVPVPGDVNGDGIVSQSELAAVLANLNGNGIVSESELDLVLSNYWPYSPFLYITNLAGLGGTNVTFSLPDSTSGAFSVQYSTDLVNWYYLGAATPLYEYTDTNAPSSPRRYYRLRWP